jgi:ABC-type antimicrobial peptide transport system permease subunit
MLLELYITLLILNFVVFGIAFFRKSEWFWAISLVLSAFLFFASYNIVQNIAVVSNTTQVGGVLHYDYEVISNNTMDKPLSFLALGMFLFGLALFLNDLFQNFKEGKLGQRKE